MNPTIRQATANDLDDLLRFEQGIVSSEREFDSTLQDGRIHYYDIEQLIRAPNVHFLVAETAGKLIGCGYARIDAAKPYLRHSVQGYLGLMYVDPQHRGQSVNRQIVAALEIWCRSRNVLELRLEVYRGNIGAIRAYQKAGFSEHMVEMRRRLTGAA